MSEFFVKDHPHVGQHREEKEEEEEEEAEEEAGEEENEDEEVDSTATGLPLQLAAPKVKYQGVQCPHCSETVANSRFAPHLSRCMGHSSARGSSRRVAATYAEEQRRARELESEAFFGVPTNKRAKRGTQYLGKIRNDFDR
eukprot:c13472_g1_i2.p1 GENE.c13472_g1_i2~~c13472_g1_i2.p1  ORF type:complete len:141 (+),score=20.90 c13472_g1_i2:278-700(+)